MTTAIIGVGNIGDPVKAGGVDAALRIETSGDLHQFGGLNGKVIDASEGRTAVRAAA
jgi:8-hydroxy-5-deazaflavin:NADPH oxidoreductase